MASLDNPSGTRPQQGRDPRYFPQQPPPRDLNDYSQSTPPGSVWNQGPNPSPPQTYQQFPGFQGGAPGGSYHLQPSGSHRTQATWDAFFPGMGPAPRYADENITSPDHELGTAFAFPDSFGQILLNMQQQGFRGAAGPQGMLEQMYRNYAGKPEDMDEWMKRAGPALALSLMNTPGYKATQNYQQFFNQPGQYGQAAGNIADASRMALTQGQEALGSAGLGRSAAKSSLAADVSKSMGAQQSGILAQIRAQQLQQQYAAMQQAFDMQRSIAQMALGQNPGPRIPDGGGGGQWAGAAGAGLGTGLGAIIGSIIPGIGTAVGAAAGGGLGAAAAPLAQNTALFE